MPACGLLGSLVLRTSKAGGITPGRGADVWNWLDNNASWNVFIQTAVNSLQDDNRVPQPTKDSCGWCSSTACPLCHPPKCVPRHPKGQESVSLTMTEHACASDTSVKLSKIPARSSRLSESSCKVRINGFYCSCGTCLFGRKGIQRRGGVKGRGVSQTAVCELPECVCALGDMGKLGWEGAGTPQVPYSRRRPLFLGHKNPHPLSLPRWTCPGCSAGLRKLGMLGLAHIAPSIWRNVPKKQRWACNLNQSYRKGQVCGVQVRPGPVIPRDGDSQLHIPQGQTAR